MARHLGNDEIARITEMHRFGVPIKEIAEHFGIKPQTVSGVADPAKRYGEEWYARFCAEWDEARYLVSGSVYGKKGSYGAQ